MIWSAFVYLFFKTVNFFLGYLPPIDVSGSIFTSVSTASGYLTSIHQIFPYITVAIIAIFGFNIAFETSYFLFKLVYWIIRRFPTQS